MPESKNPKLKFCYGTGTSKDLYTDPGIKPSKQWGNGFLEMVDANTHNTTWGENNCHDDEGLSQKGKWIIKFENGSASLDDAWEKVKKGIREGVFMEAKVAKRNDLYDCQSIFIYTYNAEDKEDIIWVHSEIQTRGITENALEKNLSYISDKETMLAVAEDNRERRIQMTSEDIYSETTPLLPNNTSSTFSDIFKIFSCCQQDKLDDSLSENQKIIP